MQTELSIERIVPRGLQKDISPRGVDIAGNRLVVNPVTDALNRRYLSAETGEISAEQNIPGTISYDPSFPAGTNLVIGTLTDLEKNRLIIFNYNSNGNHGVYAWDPITHAFTTLIQKTLLAFSNNPRYRITGVGIIQDLLYWSDGTNPQRMINTTRDYSGITDDACINLYKRPPVQGPTFAGSSNDSTYKTSAIAGNIYQFSTRYIFKDNESSALSMYSEYVLSHIDTLSSFTVNRHGITIYYQTELAPLLSKVQLLYRKNNSPDWYLYKESLTSDFSGTSLLVYFYDDNSTTLIPANEANKLFDSVPLTSKALTTFKNRNFLTADTEGYTVEQIQSFSLPTNVGIHDIKNLKDGGNWSYGPVYYDKDMRTPGITAFKKVAANYYAGDSSGVDGNNKTMMTPAFADNLHPSWAKYVTFAKTIEQNYERYMQIPVKPMFYVGEGDLKDATGAAVTIPATMELYNNGKVYLKVLPDNVTAGKKFVHLHLQLPENIPFIPDSECLVRVISPLTGLTIGDAHQVIAFDGQSIVMNNFKTFGGVVLDWTTSTWNAAAGGPPSFLIIEVFKIKKTQSKLLYEIGKYFSGFPVSAYGLADWDTFNSNGVTAGYKFKNLKIDGKTGDICYNCDAGNAFESINVESPTSVSSNNPLPEDEQKVVFDVKDNTFSGKLNEIANALKDAKPAKGFIGELTSIADAIQNRTISRNYSFPDSSPSVIPDYRRIPDVPGRAIAYNPNAKQLNRTTTIRYSETYIQDSNINGLSSFDSLNEYPIASQRTPILKLVGAGDVLLAIHQRATTSMYIGQNQIQDNQGNIQIVSTDKVIPNDNELKGRYGSYHPESIQEYRTMVFAFDIFQGVIWKYDNNGQVPVSDQGMKTYFKLKAEQYLPYKDTVAILGGIDPYNKEYLITFPAISGVTAETWAFNWMANGGAGEWTTRYSFIPDAYGYVNNQLVSFANNKLWVHNQDAANCNVFYGVKYDRSITMSINEYPTKNKNWMAMQISAEELCEGDRYTTKVSAANFAAFPGTGVIGTLYTANDTVKIYCWNGSAYQEIRETYIITCANREVQSTYMKRKEFDKQENIFYGPILKDTNTPGVLLKAGTIALRDGRDMISQVLDLTMTNNSRTQARHHFTNISYVFSAYGF